MMSTVYPEGSPNSQHEADNRNVLAPGSKVDVWRASDRKWVAATIATAAEMRGQTPPVHGAILCMYDCNKLQKWIRPDDSLSLIRPRSSMPVHVNQPTALTRPPVGYDGFDGYVTPQTRIPVGY